MDMRAGRYRKSGPSDARHGGRIDRQGPVAGKQHHVRRKDQVVSVLADKGVEHRLPVAMPARQSWRRVRVIQHHRSLGVGEAASKAVVCAQIELGIAADRDPVRRKSSLPDEALPNLVPWHQHQIEQRALPVEPDGAVPGSVPGVNDLQPVEPVARLEQQRCLFGHDKRIEAAKKVEIVAIEQRLGRWDGAIEPRGSKTRNRRFQAQPDQACPGQGGTAQPRQFLTDRLAGIGEDDFVVTACQHLQCDGQAVRELMGLVVVEQEADAFHGRICPMAPNGSSALHRECGLCSIICPSPPAASALTAWQNALQAHPDRQNRGSVHRWHDPYTP